MPKVYAQHENVFQHLTNQGTGMGYQNTVVNSDFDALTVIGAASKEKLLASENKAYSILLNDYMQVKAELSAKKYV